MNPTRAHDWAVRHYEYPGWAATCPLCGQRIDECVCVCPFCGERNSCRCCIGLGVATGGD
jgi:hypothetical protein